MTDSDSPMMDDLANAASTARIELTGRQLEQLLQGEAVSVLHPDVPMLANAALPADTDVSSHLKALGSLVKDGLPIGGGWSLGGSVEPGGLSLSLLKRF